MWKLGTLRKGYMEEVISHFTRDYQTDFGQQPLAFHLCAKLVEKLAGPFDFTGVAQQCVPGAGGGACGLDKLQSLLQWRVAVHPVPFFARRLEASPFEANLEADLWCDVLAMFKDASQELVLFPLRDVWDEFGQESMAVFQCAQRDKELV